MTGEYCPAVPLIMVRIIENQPTEQKFKCLNYLKAMASNEDGNETFREFVPLFSNDIRGNQPISFSELHDLLEPAVTRRKKSNEEVELIRSVLSHWILHYERSRISTLDRKTSEYLFRAFLHVVENILDLELVPLADRLINLLLNVTGIDVAALFVHFGSYQYLSQFLLGTIRIEKMTARPDTDKTTMLKVRLVNFLLWWQEHEDSCILSSQLLKGQSDKVGTNILMSLDNCLDIIKLHTDIFPDDRTSDHVEKLELTLQQITPSTSRLADLYEATDRFDSFDCHSWKKEYPNLTPFKMAEAGFHLTKNDHQHYNAARCSVCNLVLFSWKNTDDPILMHLRFSPHCPFLIKNHWKYRYFIANDP